MVHFAAVHFDGAQRAMQKGETSFLKAQIKVRFDGTLIRKVPVSVKFLSAILGPEMAAPILWTPGKNAFFLQENPCP